ncbi:Ribonuclease MRP protein subunit rmp1 [Sporothrix epigloea]|uniref:Ribonuclease MRP protein subunit rmp1 n=1 Tax=Sporothrix epigloea TaxID=1892477 RepID=A0ABP0DUV0_9PEZI
MAPNGTIASLQTPPPSSSLLSPAESHAAIADRLESIDLLLHGLHRRHKNQHRVSTYWWPAFGQLRRHVRKLAAEARAAQAESALRKSAKEPAASSRVAAHARDSFDHLIPKVYLAFSRLVADRRHAQLGLLLMGVLAQVHTVLRQILDDGTAGKTDAGARGRDSRELGMAELAKAAPATTSPGLPLVGAKTADDFGEVVARDDTGKEDEESRDKKYAKIKALKTSSAGTTAPIAQPKRKRPRPEDDDGSSGEKTSVSKQPTVLEASIKESAEHMVRPGKETKPRKTADAKAEDRKEKKEKRERKDGNKIRKTKKQRKAGDEFDDLFDSLL